MDATPPANAVVTTCPELTERACPGCGARVDLTAYGLLDSASPVVCGICENSFALSEYIRV